MKLAPLAALWALTLWAGSARAETMSLFRAETFGGGAALIPAGGAGPAPDTEASADGSLFIGRDGLSFFRPFPVRIRPDTHRVELSLTGSAVERIRSIIALAEAGSAGYDAVQHGARIRTPRAPTQMTIGEIYLWIKQTPNQPHAIGRYQFIPSTLRQLVNRLGLPLDTRFTPVVQDQLADLLLAEAGLNAVTRGEIGRHEFMRNLSKIWAGLPLPSGKSHYEGYAGNKATITWAQFDGAMAQIFPR